MTELISRQAALAEIDKNREALLSSGMTGAEHILVHYGRRVIEELPSIEPKKVVEDYCRPRNLMVVGAEDFRLFTEPKPGKWEHHIGIGNVALLKCGECGFTYPEVLGMMLFNFCPNCGARMSDEHTD